MSAEERGKWFSCHSAVACTQTHTRQGHQGRRSAATSGRRSSRCCIFVAAAAGAATATATRLSTCCGKTERLINQVLFMCLRKGLSNSKETRMKGRDEQRSSTFITRERRGERVDCWKKSGAPFCFISFLCTHYCTHALSLLED